MSKDNTTPNRIQAVWNMLGGDAVVDDLLAGKLKLHIVFAGVVEPDKGNRIIIDTLEEARAVVRRYALSAIQEIGCLTVIQPSNAGNPRSVSWCHDTIALVWMLGGSDVRKQPKPFFGVSQYFSDVTRAASEIRKLYEPQTIRSSFEVLTSDQHDILVSHPEWHALVSGMPTLTTECVDHDSPYFIIRVT